MAEQQHHMTGQLTQRDAQVRCKERAWCLELTRAWAIPGTFTHMHGAALEGWSVRSIESAWCNAQGQGQAWCKGMVHGTGVHTGI